MLNLAGADQRQDDLFMNENIFSRGKSALKGLKVGRMLGSFQASSLTMMETVRALKMSTPNTPHTFAKPSTSF